MNKKILIASIVTLASVAGVVGTVGNAHKVEAATPEKLYLSPNANWKVDNARFAAYFFGNGEKWVSMTDTDKDGIYEVDTPSGYPSVIFCRMTPSATANNWNNKWNQTADLTIPTNGNDYYTVKEGTWDKGGGTWSKFVVEGEEIDPCLEVGTLVDTYLNNGFYLRDTEINIDMTDEEVQQDLITAFHAKAIATERLTYFEGDQLWMTNEEGTINSGYGTSNEGMTHFSYVDGAKKVDSTVPGTSMEEYYTTLKDISESISESQVWTKLEDGTYKSSNTELVSKFLDFTAPCFLNSKDKNSSNIFTLSYATIKEVSQKLVLSLYVGSDTSGFIKDGSLLLSKATISKLSYVDIRGGFNNWAEGNPKIYLHTAGQEANVYKTTINLESQTYEFKLLEDEEWYGNKTTITNTIANLQFSKNEPSNCKITITTAGVYEFAYDISTHKLTVKQI